MDGTQAAKRVVHGYPFGTLANDLQLCPKLPFLTNNRDSLSQRIEKETPGSTRWARQAGVLTSIKNELPCTCDYNDDVGSYELLHSVPSGPEANGKSLAGAGSC